MTSEEAKVALEGIAGLACRLAEAEVGTYRVKPGGETNRGNATIDWYLTVQNMLARKAGDADPAINTSAAREGKLRRQMYRIIQYRGEAEPRLVISEWNAEQDWHGQYRDIWSGDVAPKTRQEMARKMAEAIKGFRS